MAIVLRGSLRFTPHMISPRRLTLGLVSLLMALLSFEVSGASSTPLNLWPQSAPGEKGNIGAEAYTTKPSEGLVGGKRLIRLGNVSQPTLTIYRPKSRKSTGAAVLVCPGGGYHILAMDLEGSEVCEWLNSIGVTAALLKYRVPRRPELDKHLPPLQDAQRAMSLLRLHAKEWGIDPGRIGVIGFSAGGHLAASLSTATARAYTPMDDTDKLSPLPDFTVLVYPAYLTVKENGDKISPELKISPSTPQTFIVITQDDPVRVENAMHYTLALQAVKVPVELHVYPTGGHGYGLRRTGEVVTTWPDRLSDWLRSRGILKANP